MRPNKLARASQKKTIQRLMGYVTRTYRFQFAWVLVTICISALSGVAGSLFLKILIDDYITPLLGREYPNFTALAQAVMGMGAIYYIGVVCTYVYNRLMINIAQGTLKTIRDELFEHMQKLPIQYFDTHTHGELMSRYTNDVDTLRQMISISIPQIFMALITMVSVFCAMLAISIHLTVFAMVMLGMMILVMRKIGGKSRKFFTNQQNNLGQMNGYIQEMMNGQKVIKVFCHEDEAKKEFARLNERLYESSTDANTFANILMPVMMNLGNLQYVLTAIFGGALAVKQVGGLTLGAIVSFLQLTRSFNMPIGQVSQQMNAIIMALAGAERIFDLMDQQPEQDNGYVTLVHGKYTAANELTEAGEPTGIWAWKHPHADGSVTYTELRGDVRFDDVDFGYYETETVLHNICLFAKPGQKIAFVGATGAGKTTITNLLNRFYDIQDGKIRVDGINITKIRKSDLRRAHGMVLQDIHLFTGTIMENIRYGKLDADDNHVYAAAKLANADAFIRHLPNGYHTVISGDGEGLSQGQRQLLAIARAAVANPPILILDEATSSIDTRTEAIVQKGMDRLMEGRTVFVIAHRLSTVKNSDAIMVLEHGRIIERGNHDDLIAQKGRYYQLYTGAFELE